MSASVKSSLSCPLCGQSETRSRFQARDALVTNEWFELRDCLQCGLTFTVEPPPEQNLGRYYQSEDYVSHVGKPQGLWGRTYQAARKLSVRSKRRFVEAQTGIQAGAILDYGCGVGFFLDAMARHGWQVAGVEPAELARNSARDLLPGPVLAPEDFLPDRSPKQDVITLWHVLEHIRNPDKILLRLRENLKPGGWIIIAVPNAASWEAQTYGPDWAAWDLPRHLFHFSPERLGKLLESAGFEPRTLRTLPLDPFYISLLSERQMGVNGNLFRGSWRGVQSFIRGAIRAEKGSSVVWVARAI